MINGIIKLFYSDVVKVKMKNMTGPNAKDINDEDLKPAIRNIKKFMYKVDHVLTIILKLSIYIVSILITFNINVFLGIGAMIVLLLYGYYKNFIKEQVIENVNDIKLNIESKKENLITDSVKYKINALIAILFISIVSGFNKASIAAFIVVLLFTIKDIYSNIKYGNIK